MFRFEKLKGVMKTKIMLVILLTSEIFFFRVKRIFVVIIKPKLTLFISSHFFIYL